MVVPFLLLAAGAVCSSDTLQHQIAQIAAGANGRVGVAAMLIESGASLRFHSTERYPMQSVYKLPIGMAVLSQVDNGKLKLDQVIRVEKAELVPSGLYSPIRDQHPNGGFDMILSDLLRYMVSESDGTASDVLLRIAGGPEVVTKYLRGLGIDGVIVATSEMAMSRSDQVQYRNWATPDSALILLRTLHEGRGVSPASRTLLLDLMIQGTRGLNRIKGSLPAGTIVAHKPGSAGTHNGFTRATNDIGIVTLPDGRHIAIAVFVSDAKADQPTCEGVIARISRAVWDCWAGSR